MRHIIFIGCVVFFLFIFPFFQGSAVSDFSVPHPECSYGVCDAWLSKDKITWLNTTIDSMNLLPGEIFYVKTYVSVKKDPVWVALLFFEPGVESEKQSTYEILEGQTSMCSMVDLGKFHLYDSKTILWTLRVKPDTKWVNATAPLNIGVFFDIKENNSWCEEDITFTLVNAYIFENENSCFLERNSFIQKTESNTTSSTFSFFFGSLLFSCMILIYLLKRRMDIK